MEICKPSGKPRFGEIAVRRGFMTDDQVSKVLSQKGISSRKLGQLCIDSGYLTEEQLSMIVAEQFSLAYTDLSEPIDPDVIEPIPIELMMRHRFIPVSCDGLSVKIAVADPMEYFKFSSEFEMITGLSTSITISAEVKILEILKRIESSSNVLDAVSGDMRLPLVKSSGDGKDVLTIDRVTAEESPIIKLVDSTIIDAINKHASDIHIEAAENGVVIRYRIDGMLHQATDPLDTKYLSTVISRIKVMSELDISETRIPQDGRFKLKIKDRFVDFRVSILPASFGENAVIRILDSERMSSDNNGGIPLSRIGMPANELARMRRMVKAPYGMFLLTGPTGSGKTTTLYSAMSEVKNSTTKIITIEDPVEYQIPGITQIPVNEKKGLTFAKGLRSVLRHDPDKILVGEIRDSETAQIAIQSALTGHLVFTTVHANSSFEVINRFVHMGIEPYNLMSALNCIVAQRLIRTLCTCKKRVDIPWAEMIESGLDPAKYADSKFYGAAGCDKCNGTGFNGRKAIIELIELTGDMKELFISRASAANLKKSALDSGATLLRSAALVEVLNGVTTLEEANRVTFVEASG